MKIDSITLIIRDVDDEDASIETIIKPKVEEGDGVEITPCVVLFERIFNYLEDDKARATSAKASLH